MNGENVSLLVLFVLANSQHLGLSSFTAGSWKMDNWMKCQPHCQKCEQSVFLRLMLIKQSHRIG